MKQNCNCKNRRHGTSPDTQVRESRFTEDNQCEQTEKNKVVFTDYVQEPPRHSSPRLPPAAPVFSRPRSEHPRHGQLGARLLDPVRRRDCPALKLEDDAE
jgi:hypothetical protein